MSALDLLVDEFPHGTKAGFDQGCRSAHCPAPIACRDFARRYAGDFTFRRLIDGGMTAAEVFAMENPDATADDAESVRERLHREAAEAACAAVARAFEILHDIPPVLRAAGELRLRYPDASLSELALLADPPLTRSQVTSRLRRLVIRATEQQSRTLEQVT